MKILEAIVVSFQFLTRFYLPIKIDWDEKNIKYSLLFFPLVGAAIGAVLFGVNYLTAYTKINPALTILFAWIIITGGLHLDGVSDTVDGLSARADRERTLKIMDDSHIGAFGVIAIVMLILFKYDAISKLVCKNPYAIFASPVIARCIAGFFLTFFKTAKTTGLASYFHQSSSKVITTISVLITIAIIFYFNQWWLMRFLYTFLAITILTIPVYRKLNGLTGDVYGSIVELSEIIFMMLCII